MAQIVGYRHVSGTSKRTGKPFDAYVVSWIEKETESGAFGYRAGDEFVNRELFEKATEGMAADEILNAMCDFVFNRSGFLQDFKVYAKEGKSRAAKAAPSVPE